MSPHCPGHLNIWFPVSGPVWVGLGGAALLEKVCDWGWSVGLQSLVPFLVLKLMLVIEDVSSQLPAQATVPATCCHLPHMTDSSLYKQK